MNSRALICSSLLATLISFTVNNLSGEERTVSQGKEKKNQTSDVGLFTAQLVTSQSGSRGNTSWAGDAGRCLLRFGVAGAYAVGSGSGAGCS